MIAPTFAVAYCTIVHSAQLGAQMPTRSPFAMPAAAGGHLDERLAFAGLRDDPLEVGADRLLEQRGGGLTCGVGLHGGHPSERPPRATTPRTARLRPAPCDVRRPRRSTP